MCGPKAVEALTWAAGGANAIGSVQAGETSDAVAGVNARLLRMQAQDALERGSLEESRYRSQIRQVEGTQKAQIGASNVTRSGTALDLLEDTARIGEEDAQTIRNNAAREALGLQNQARIVRAQGRSDKQMGRFGAGTSLLTAGANVYGYRRLRGE